MQIGKAITALEPEPEPSPAPARPWRNDEGAAGATKDTTTRTGTMAVNGLQCAPRSIRKGWLDRHANSGNCEMRELRKSKTSGPKRGLNACGTSSTTKDSKKTRHEGDLGDDASGSSDSAVFSTSATGIRGRCQQSATAPAQRLQAFHAIRDNSGGNRGWDYRRQATVGGGSVESGAAERNDFFSEEASRRRTDCQDVHGTASSRLGVDSKGEQHRERTDCSLQLRLGDNRTRESCPSRADIMVSFDGGDEKGKATRRSMKNSFRRRTNELSLEDTTLDTVGMTDGNRPTPPALSKSKSCGNGCGMKLASSSLLSSSSSPTNTCPKLGVNIPLVQDSLSNESMAVSDRGDLASVLPRPGTRVDSSAAADCGISEMKTREGGLKCGRGDGRGSEMKAGGGDGGRPSRNGNAQHQLAPQARRAAAVTEQNENGKGGPGEVQAGSMANSVKSTCRTPNDPDAMGVDTSAVIQDDPIAGSDRLVNKDGVADEGVKRSRSQEPAAVALDIKDADGSEHNSYNGKGTGPVLLQPAVGSDDDDGISSAGSGEENVEKRPTNASGARSSDTLADLPRHSVALYARKGSTAWDSLMAEHTSAAAPARGPPPPESVHGAVHGASFFDAGEVPTSDSMVDIHISSTGEITYKLRPGTPRRGKWSRLEEEYAKRIISDFDAGLLDAEPGTGLRQLLAAKLQCEVMRVSKKFCGWASVGKRSFRPVRNLNGDATRAQASLFVLEQRWLKTFPPNSGGSRVSIATPAASASSGASSTGSLARLVPAPPFVEREGGGIAGMHRPQGAMARPEQWSYGAERSHLPDASRNAMDVLSNAEGWRHSRHGLNQQLPAPMPRPNMRGNTRGQLNDELVNGGEEIIRPPPAHHTIERLPASAASHSGPDCVVHLSDHRAGHLDTGVAGDGSNERKRLWRADTDGDGFATEWPLTPGLSGDGHRSSDVNGRSEPLYPIYSKQGRYDSAAADAREQSGGAGPLPAPQAMSLSVEKRHGHQLPRSYSPCNISRPVDDRGRRGSFGCGWHGEYVTTLRTAYSQRVNEEKIYTKHRSHLPTPPTRRRRYPSAGYQIDRSIGYRQVDDDSSETGDSSSSSTHHKRDSAGSTDSQSTAWTPSGGMFRLRRHPTPLPAHLRVDNSSSSSVFFPGGGRAVKTAVAVVNPLKDSHESSSRSPLSSPLALRSTSSGLGQHTAIKMENAREHPGTERWSHDQRGCPLKIRRLLGPLLPLVIGGGVPALPDSVDYPNGV